MWRVIATDHLEGLARIFGCCGMERDKTDAVTSEDFSRRTIESVGDRVRRRIEPVNVAILFDNEGAPGPAVVLVESSCGGVGREAEQPHGATKHDRCQQNGDGN